MYEIYSTVFQLLTGKLELMDSYIDNYIIMTIIGVVAFSVAYSLVGKLYKHKIIVDRESGSLFHWTIRLIIFIGLFYSIKFIINNVELFIIIAFILIAFSILIKVIRFIKDVSID